jgi:hypothetical protein
VLIKEEDVGKRKKEVKLKYNNKKSKRKKDNKIMLKSLKKNYLG